MRVGTFNVHKCVGADGEFSPERTALVLAEMGADLVAVQEADRRFGRRRGLLDGAAIERRAGLRLLAQSDLPEGQGWHGNALLVRGAPRLYRRRRLRLPGLEPRGAVVADLDLGAGAVRVVAAHLGLLRGCRAAQARAIVEALAEMEPLPTVLMGDLNEWRPRGGRALAAFERAFGPPPPPSPSFPARMPLLPLDRIMGWPPGLVGAVRVHDTPLARLASDHLPLTADLAPPAA